MHAHGCLQFSMYCSARYSTFCFSLAARSSASILSLYSLTPGLGAAPSFDLFSCCGCVCCLGFGCGLDCGLDTLVKYFHSSKTLVAGHVYRQDSFVSFSRGIVHKCTPNLSHRERRD